MAQAAFRQLLLGVAASGLLAGCVASTGGDGGAGTEATASAPTAPRSGAGREVEAPEVFQTTDSALWDGRPSLGGIWVASPDAVDPERVVMFNPATGKSVTGALFRRERDNPGPTLQVSSDAAEALGMLAGQPTELRVTALRREEPPPEVPVEATPPVDPLPEGAAAEAPTEPPSEAEALAAAALEATGTAADPAIEGAEGAAEAAVATEEPPKRKTWKERRAEAKAKREAEKAAEAEAEAAAAAAEGAVIPTTPVDPDAGQVSEVETAPLDARAPEASAPTESAPVVVESPAAEAPAAAGPARTIQIASFSKEENAKRAIEALSKIGIPAEVRKADRNGTPFWGVVAVGDAALLAQIRKAGFADAYFLQ